MPLIIPIYIPHEGCPHCCIFCNQHSISGQSGQSVAPDEVAGTITAWLDRCKPENRGQVEVAFYGGSFSGLPATRQADLLGAVRPFLEQGQVQAVRISTRPDYIDEERLDLLVRHRVGIIELGAQSCDDQVLRRAARGHTGGAVIAASRLIKARGIRLGIQLMLGLPGDCRHTLRQTVQTVIRLRPDFIRLYPVLVLRGSGLEQLYHRGGYRPLSLGMAVLLAAWSKKRFDDQGIPVVRMGLQPTIELEQGLVAGPYHPSFGHLVDSRLMLRRTRQALATTRGTDKIILKIASRDLSIFRGLRSGNMHRLQELGLLARFFLQTDSSQPRHTLKVVRGESPEEFRW